MAQNRLPDENSGARKVIDDLAEKREKFFANCVSGETRLKLTRFDESIIYCLFVRYVPGSINLTVNEDGVEKTGCLLYLQSVKRA